MGKQIITLDYLIELAESKGGKCLSKVYNNRREKLLWQCDKGHTWESPANSILYANVWCKVCGEVERVNKRRLDIEKVKEIGKQKNIKLLSSEYLNSSQKLDWKCVCGHKFKANITSVRTGKIPCPSCRKINRVPYNKKGIDFFKKYAKENNGILLKETKDGHFIFQCKEGHEWTASRNNVLSGSWCVKCSYHKRGIRKRADIKVFQEIAIERGGKLISKGYQSNEKKLEWECNKKHRWKATPGSVKQGSWCPHCSSGVGERICRIYFEEIFSLKFPRAYPDWLRNSRGNQMELDGYCEEIKIAFEHHGEQHYSLSTKYIKEKSLLNQRIEDDELKMKLCKDRGIKLFIIPSILQITKIDDVKGVIKVEANRVGVKLPNNFDTLEVKYKKAYRVDYHEEKLSELKQIAKIKGGDCLSEHYINDRTKLKFKCIKGHVWETIPKDVFRGHWCFNCAVEHRANKSKLTIDDLRKIAKKHKGELLSEVYIGYDNKLKWRCKEGHEFESSIHRIKSGKWCPMCMQQERSKLLNEKREVLSKIAEKKNGKLISSDYENNKRELLWQCSSSHQWLAPADRIKQGAWCPICAQNQPFTLEYINKYANEKGGECLSTYYENYRTMLTWKCSEGHIFENRFINIKNGSWCPICRKQKK